MRLEMATGERLPLTVEAFVVAVAVVVSAYFYPPPSNFPRLIIAPPPPPPPYLAGVPALSALVHRSHPFSFSPSFSVLAMTDYPVDDGDGELRRGGELTLLARLPPPRPIHVARTHTRTPP